MFAEGDFQVTELQVLIEDGDKKTDLTKIMDRFGIAEEDHDGVLNEWLRQKETVGFLAVWEHKHNPDFNMIGFQKIRQEVGLNRFCMSVAKWRECVNGTALSMGANNNVFSHCDVAFSFCSWLSPEFQLCLIQEFQRLQRT